MENHLLDNAVSPSVKMILLLLLILFCMLVAPGSAFVGSQPRRRPFLASSTRLFDRNKEINWMDRRVPLDIESSKEEAIRRVGEIEEYDIGISGISFQTGPLSAQLLMR
ncbi:hypothetical protein MHU86_18684 [Fragilaria crotonensis]|nr:hypothetical protein MHU86_18684 [Fragilaria crotonensis]